MLEFALSKDGASRWKERNICLSRTREMKDYMQPGECCHFRRRKIMCKEISLDLATHAEWCDQCCLVYSYLCYWMRCRKRERTDGKDVIFVYSELEK